MTDEQREYLKRRIQQLRSRQQSVGPFRAAGIQRTIDGLKDQLKRDVWSPPLDATALARWSDDYEASLESSRASRVQP